MGEVEPAGGGVNQAPSLTREAPQLVPLPFCAFVFSPGKWGKNSTCYLELLGGLNVATWHTVSATSVSVMVVAT